MNASSASPEMCAAKRVDADDRRPELAQAGQRSVERGLLCAAEAS